MIDTKAIDPACDEFLANMIVAQEEFRSAKRGYLQVMEDGSVAQDAAVTVLVDGPVVKGEVTKVPVVEPVVADDYAVPDEKALPCKSRVDVYEAPRGFGYSVTFTVIDGADTWERTEADGPEAAERSHDWKRVGA